MEIAPLPPPIPFPEAFTVPGQQLNVPALDAPRWTPIPPPPPEVPMPPAPRPAPAEEQSEEKEEEKEKEEKEKDEDKESIDTDMLIPEYDNSITIPIVDTELPLPANEVMIVTATTATIAAVASVGGAIVAKTIFDYLLKLIKPTIKTVVNKILKARGKKPITWGRQRLLERQRRLRDKG